ncbi:MAG: hypothetical protein E2P02_28360 [Acidobacteria bacterium]|nr:MAG: hypothetical protein E2P02_28360 [Acidobacteriota bacterium]
MSESAKHVEELTIMRFLDGELSQEREQKTREHLIRCASCRAAHEALKAETELLRAAILEREEALPGHLRPRHADVSWVLVAMIAFGTLAVSTLWTRYVQPIIESMESIGLDGTSVATSLVIQGILWEGWSDMFTDFFEGMALFLVAVAAGCVLHWGWRRFLSSAATLSLLLVALSGVLTAPASVQAAVIKHVETYTLREGEVIDNDLIVLGRRVVIKGTVTGDLIVCAVSVEISGEVQGDVLGIARRIEVTGSINGSLRAGAQTLIIDGEVGRNITAGGEVVRLRPGATLRGSLIAGFREVVLNAPVPRDLILAAKTSQIDARIGGSVLVFGERLEVGPNGAIGGEAKFFGAKEPEVSADAQLNSPFEFEKVEDDEEESMTSRIWALFGYWAAAFILSAAIMLMTPEATEGVVTRHVPDYGKSFLVGLIASVVLFAFTFLVSVTLVGLPLGLTTAFVLTIGLYFSQAYVAAYIGREILGTPTSAGQALGRVALGLFLIYIAKSIPVVGSVVTMIAALWGFGALSLYVMDRRKQTENAVPAEA